MRPRKPAAGESSVVMRPKTSPTVAAPVAHGATGELSKTSFHWPSKPGVYWAATA